MKKAVFFVPFIMILIILPFISCKSAPPVQESVEQPQQVPVEPPSAGPSQELLNQLDAAAAKAEQARKKAEDFETPAYFPGEWEAAQGLYDNAGQMPRGTDEEARKAIAAYEEAAAAFDSAFALAVPLYAQAREDEIIMARNDLIAAGARETLSEYFAPADDTALTALDQYEAGDYYAARDSAAKALMMYQSLRAGYDAWMTSEEITLRKFEGYDPDNFDRGGEILSDAADAYKADNIPAALQNARDSLERYNIVLLEGWTGYSELRASLAGAERQAALDVKADIAAKDLFQEADSLYKPALTELKDKNYEEAVKHFTSAQALYVIASESASEKRRRAAAAIIGASDKIQASSEIAKQAEMAIEGGVQ